jgi:hypothetical protein
MDGFWWVKSRRASARGPQIGPNVRPDRVKKEKKGRIFKREREVKRLFFNYAVLSPNFRVVNPKI